MYTLLLLYLCPIMGLMISRCVVAQNGYVNVTVLNATDTFDHLNVIYFNPTATRWSNTSYVESLHQNQSVRIPPIGGELIWLNGGVWLQGVFKFNPNRYKSILVVPSSVISSSAEKSSVFDAYKITLQHNASVWIKVFVCDSSVSACEDNNDVTTSSVSSKISGETGSNQGSSTRSFDSSTSSLADHNAVPGNSDSSRTALIIVCVLEAVIIVLVVVLTRKYWYPKIACFRTKGEDDNQNDVNDAEIVTEHVNSPIIASTIKPITGGGDNFHSNNAYGDVEEESNDAVVDYDYPQFEGHCRNANDTDT